MTHTLHTRSPWLVALAATAMVLGIALSATACTDDSQGVGYPPVAEVEVVAQGEQYATSISALVELSDTIAQITVSSVGKARFNTESGEQLAPEELRAVREDSGWYVSASDADTIFQTMTLQTIDVIEGTPSVEGYVVAHMGGAVDNIVFEPMGRWVNLDTVDEYPDAIVFLSSLDALVEESVAFGLRPDPFDTVVQDTASELTAAGHTHEAMAITAWYQLINGNAVDGQTGSGLPIAELAAEINAALGESFSTPRGNHRRTAIGGVGTRCSATADLIRYHIAELPEG